MPVSLCHSRPLSAVAAASVGDPQIGTDHAQMRGELSCSNVECLDPAKSVRPRWRFFNPGTAAQFWSVPTGKDTVSGMIRFTPVAP